MSFRESISKLLRRRRDHRHAPLKTAASTGLIQTLLVQQRIHDLKTQHAQSNPLLASGYKVFSQNDEDGIINEICSRIGCAREGHFVEIGVGDGSENNTLNLFSKGWHGIWLGGEPLAYPRLSNRISFKQCWITRENVAQEIRSELERKKETTVDLISIDIDGNDWHIVKSILASGLTPSIFAVEYNGSLDPLCDWVMPYEVAHVWDKSAYFGASLAAFNRLFSAHGYFLAACNVTGVNAFFVRQEFKAAFPELPTEWHTIHMPACYLPYPYLGHAVSQRFIQAMIGE